MKTLRRFKRFVALSCVAALTAGLFAGCAGTDSVTKYTLENEKKTEISFSWWGNDIRHDYTMEAVKIFQQENPDVKVETDYGVWGGYEKRYNLNMMSDNETDVMQINFAWLSKYSPDGEGYYDLNTLKDYINFAGYTNEMLSYGYMNGKLNAIPIALNTSTLYYNADIFKKYGLELPKSWDDLFAAAEVMSEDGIYPLGMSKKQLFLFLITWYEQLTGKEPFDENGNWIYETEDVRNMLDYYGKLRAENVICSVDDFGTGMFSGGQVAGVMVWASDAETYCAFLEENKIDVRIGEYPVMEDAKMLGWYLKPATMYAISRITDEPVAAARFLDYLLNSEEMIVRQGTEKGVPCNVIAIRVLQEHDMLDGLEYRANQMMESRRRDMKVMPAQMEDEDIINIFKDGADKYLFDRATLKEAAEEIQNLITEFNIE
ncbi:MAG: ABC transporter substrate-binding protein [Lachnospiraceae bacterium]|nr:ABC transporter substrate-binding protein [Lachnospiraceae bacterium]